MAIDPVPPEPEGDGLTDEGEDFEGDDGTRKIYVSGVPVRILAERVEYIGIDGKLVTEILPGFCQEADRVRVRVAERFPAEMERGRPQARDHRGTRRAWRLDRESRC